MPTADPMTKTIRSLVCLLLLTQVAACAGPSATAHSGRQAIEARYAQATALYKQNMAPLAQYFVKTCGPMADHDYLDCINGKRNDIAALSIYPEQPAAAEERQMLERRLLDKQIDRKQFRAQLEALKIRYDAEQLQRDIDNGQYSGRY